MFLFTTYSADYNEILHTMLLSWRVKISLWSVGPIFIQSTANFGEFRIRSKYRKWLGRQLCDYFLYAAKYFLSIVQMSALVLIVLCRLCVVLRSDLWSPYHVTLWQIFTISSWVLWDCNLEYLPCITSPWLYLWSMCQPFMVFLRTIFSIVKSWMSIYRHIIGIYRYICVSIYMCVCHNKSHKLVLQNTRLLWYAFNSVRLSDAGMCQ